MKNLLLAALCIAVVGCTDGMLEYETTQEALSSPAAHTTMWACSATINLVNSQQNVCKTLEFNNWLQETNEIDSASAVCANLRGYEGVYTGACGAGGGTIQNPHPNQAGDSCLSVDGGTSDFADCNVLCTEPLDHSGSNNCQ